MDKVREVEMLYMRMDIPQFKAGDRVRVHTRIVEGDKERIQMFEGTVIKMKRSGLGSTFTVRKISHGIGVERTFPINSPSIEKIEVLGRGIVRRAKLYYLRDRIGKAAKVKEKIGGKKA